MSDAVSGAMDANAPRQLMLPWRMAGAALLVLSVVPLYAWLQDPATGIAGAATADMAASASNMIWAGTLVAAAIAIFVARLVSADRADRTLARARHNILQMNHRSYAAVAAFVGFGSVVFVQYTVFHNQPVLIDAISQIVHARYLAAGHVMAPADTIGFFRIQQTVPVPGGWISQYPPFHVVVLAVGELLHATPFVGPIALAFAIFFTALAMERLLPGRASVRVGILLAACSPFTIAHAATYMSHTTAAACIALALYACARVSDGTSRRATMWTIMCGLAIGATFATRPLTGLTAGSVIALYMLRMRNPAVPAWRVVALLFAGSVPMVLAVMLHNAHFFGSPTRFGYDIALGPRAGLGFGTDPWGNAYGLKQALAYTSAELNALSLQMYESPLPFAALVAVYLLVARAMRSGEALVFALALAPIITHMLYWHHGLFMGPRMLNEYGIVWSVAFAVAVAGLIDRLPVMLNGSLSAYSPRAFALGVLALGVTGALLLAPERLASYATTPSRAFAAANEAGDGTVVFVHGGWAGRASMQLAARGWRLDEVEAALRQNTTCTVQRFLDGQVARSSLDLVPRATGLPRRVEFPAGNGMRVQDGEPWPASCAAQVSADSAGVLDPSALVWRGSLPGLATHGPMFARDLGPSLDRALLPHNANARVLMRGADGAPILVSYADGMSRLWKTQVNE